MLSLIVWSLVSQASSTLEWVTKGCDDVAEFPSSWTAIVKEAPYLAQEMELIAKESGATKVFKENGNDHSIIMTSCNLTFPTEKGTAVEGLRTITTYHTWPAQNPLYAAGILVDYVMKNDPVEGVTRRIKSTVTCRNLSACQRRGILPPPRPEQPEIILESSPKRPTRGH